MSDNHPVYTKMIVAVDGSEYSLRAAVTATRLAKHTRASLIVVTVMTIPDYIFVGSGMTPEVMDKIYSDSKKNAQSIVDNVVKMAKEAGLEASGEILNDSRSVVQTIVDFAEKNNADLIVVGTRGMGNLKRALLGSVSSGVATHAHCSVLIVR